MTQYAAFRRMPAPQQAQQKLRVLSFPAPTRGIILDENESIMQAGGAVVLDNWWPTLRGLVLRGGCERWCELPETDPVISAFEYAWGASERMFAANETKLYEVTTSTPVLVQSGQASGNYSAAQMSSTGGTNYLLAVNDAGDKVLRYNGTSWVQLNPPAVPGDGATAITGPVGTPVQFGQNLSYVWKYRNRLFFTGLNTMDAWYLDIDSVGGLLTKLPLSGAATHGGHLIAGASWSLDAGDGIDQKCVFFTSLGEVLIFTGTNPGDSANWRQQGRYYISPLLGNNAHIQVGGDLLVATVNGIVPLSQALQKAAGQLELAMITRPIKSMWREEVDAKREWQWTMKQWDERGGVFVTTPGGDPGNRYCLTINNATGAWSRTKGWDATCFVRMRGDMFFGTQEGLIMQADVTGKDDGEPYVATMVGGWENFRSPANQVVWHQARAVFTANNNQMFEPQLDATVDYVITIPQPPPPSPDPGVLDVWDQGLWGYDGSGDLDPPPPADIAAYAQWDQPSVTRAPHRNTMWRSIGKMGFAHAPIVQVQIWQDAKPNVELIAIAATYEMAGVNV